MRKPFGFSGGNGATPRESSPYMDESQERQISPDTAHTHTSHSEEVSSASRPSPCYHGSSHSGEQEANTRRRQSPDCVIPVCPLREEGLKRTLQHKTARADHQFTTSIIEV
ncbi:hypothetical protein E5288_WYG021790 [Bos mutus]|uniref:Uncharacterized protein n=1 Tax=Bos mutus TaxID=72004 RepID=A0A6B0S9E0_9CETA|nr:hypothetical protein [Bos mutus]